ncbi:hypothetical protein [Nocardia terpenica]|uniref:Uncharacterized protein n=1 Tax=Nocardia terpenica TaxID=455432 RepID=A0A291RZ02_9NOCA|nr:hypothetical protein [Nocardia terpenica]ATL72502.1 hypothetical protein CRH09_39710 [Nocardia terpenica]
MTTSDIKGLTLSVYRSAEADADFTLGGITAKYDRVTVVGVLNTTDPRVNGTIVPVAEWRANPVRDDAPPVVVVVRRAGIWRNGEREAHLEPVELTDDGRIHRRPGTAHGGNFAGNGASQFRQVLSALLEYPAPDVLRVHDRYER